jgi:uncharacterized membrane protein YeaQ/YmgE (transglycosylase-associated protein family)
MLRRSHVDLSAHGRWVQRSLPRAWMFACGQDHCSRARFAGAATQVVNRTGEGLVRDIILGIIGAVVGGAIFQRLGYAGVTGVNLSSIVVAVIGAVIVLVVYLSPAELTNLPRCCSMSESMILRYEVSVYSVAFSSSPMRRLYPYTSAQSMAVSLRSNPHLGSSSRSASIFVKSHGPRPGEICRLRSEPIQSLGVTAHGADHKRIRTKRPRRAS